LGFGVCITISGNSGFGGLATDNLQNESSIDPDMLDKLLRYGAYHLYLTNETKDKNDDIALLNEDIETILQRSTTITYTDTREGRNELFANFSKASFVLNENDTTINIDDDSES
jgi:hypothetical protein